MNIMKTFKERYKFGAIYEKRSFEKLSKMYNINETWIPNFDKRYDFILNKLKYEVKTDRIAYKTNRFYIKTMYKGQNAGIITTESDYYIIVEPSENNETYYLIETTTLKKLIKDRDNISANNGETAGRLIDKEELIEYSDRIF